MNWDPNPRVLIVLVFGLAGALAACAPASLAPLVTPQPTIVPPTSTASPTRVVPSPQPTTVEPTPEPPDVSLTILYDNNRHDDRLKTAWGFACLVRRGDLTLLFDTGGDAATLLANMRTLGCDPSEIDVIVLSHAHGDHVGGLDGVLEVNDHAIVYVPDAFTGAFKERVAQRAQVIVVGEPVAIAEGVLTTGQMGTAIPEQGLIVSTQQGPIVITGCAHPGIVNMVSRAHDLLDDDIHMVIGGFHLGSASRAQVEDIVAEFRRMDVEQVVPCHCTGDAARSVFQEAYGDDCSLVGVGWSWHE